MQPQRRGANIYSGACAGPLSCACRLLMGMSRGRLGQHEWHSLNHITICRVLTFRITIRIRPPCDAAFARCEMDAPRPRLAPWREERPIGRPCARGKVPVATPVLECLVSWVGGEVAEGGRYWRGRRMQHPMIFSTSGRPTIEEVGQERDGTSCADSGVRLNCCACALRCAANPLRAAVIADTIAVRLQGRQRRQRRQWQGRQSTSGEAEGVVVVAAAASHSVAVAGIATGASLADVA